jgi:hypothetical protein
MSMRSVLVGVGAGLLAGWGLVALLSPRGRAPEHPLAEDAGRITRVVIHYAPGADAGEVVADIYRRFLAAVGPEVRVVWVVEDAHALDDLKARLDDAYPPDSLALTTGHAITTWSKDRFTCLASIGGRGATTLLAPARKAVPNPRRTNDQEVPWRLATAFPQLFACRDMQMDFDGGDILATSHGVFVHPAILSKNDPAAPPFQPAEALRERLRLQLGEFVWLGPAESDVPPHHVGMFLTVANGTAFVGDVRLAERLASGHEAELAAACLPAGGPADAATRAELARQLDCVAEQMRRLGLRVVRVPLMPSATARAWMSYNNGIVETRDGRVVYYMPTFGMSRLDDAAAEIFRGAGCDVVPIDCSRIWRLCGSLHCLVNVVARR